MRELLDVQADILAHEETLTGIANDVMLGEDIVCRPIFLTS